MVAESQRPHPGASYRRGVGFEEAPDNDAILEHVIIVIVSLA
jgi:hypothetical protein